MSDKFPRAKKLGYSVAQVEQFLALAKDQFLNPNSTEMDVKTVRGIRFDLEKNGYSISTVDSAMEKLDDVFAQRELERKFDLMGYESFLAETNELRDLLLSRVARNKGKRFAKRAWPLRGYNLKQVDSLCSLLTNHLNQSSPLALRDVRLSVFKPKRGGYAEYQVDAFIDRIVELLQREVILNKVSS